MRTIRVYDAPRARRTTPLAGLRGTVAVARRRRPWRRLAVPEALIAEQLDRQRGDQVHAREDDRPTAGVDAPQMCRPLGVLEDPATARFCLDLVGELNELVDLARREV